MSSEAQEANASAPLAANVPLHQEAEGSASLIATEAQKPSTVASQLSRSSSSRAMESAPDGGQGNAGAAWLYIMLLYTHVSSADGYEIRLKASSLPAEIWCTAAVAEIGLMSFLVYKLTLY